MPNRRPLTPAMTGESTAGPTPQEEKKPFTGGLGQKEGALKSYQTGSQRGKEEGGRQYGTNKNVLEQGADGKWYKVTYMLGEGGIWVVAFEEALEGDYVYGESPNPKGYGGEYGMEIIPFEGTEEGDFSTSEMAAGAADPTTVGAVPYDPTAPMDPTVQAMIDNLVGKDGGFEEQYAARLKKQAGAQLMARQQDPTQAGQAMGSRGLGRVAQVAQQTEQQYLSQLVQAQYVAEEQARVAGNEIRAEVVELLKFNLTEQGKIQEWNDADRTHMANQYNEYLTALDNMITQLSNADVLDTEAEWEALGVRLREANKAFAAATTDEERKNVTLYYWGELTYVPASA